MARHVELGLNPYSPENVHDYGREKPNFDEIGAQRLARTKEAIKSGSSWIFKRLMASPAAGRYYGRAGLDKIEDGFIKAGEWTIEPAVKAKEAAQAKTANAIRSTVEGGYNGYKALETRATNAWDRYSAAREKARKAVEAKKNEARFQKNRKKLEDVLFETNKFARATGRPEFALRRMT